ncbi:MAG: hypothetical protein Q9227_007807 [Pyrenula ochraceoflavens]
MSLDPASFTPLNPATDFTQPSSMEYFTLTASPNTTLTRKPPLPDTITAPVLYTGLRHPFVVAEVTISAHWDCEWDQAGLVIFNGIEPGGNTPPLQVSRLRSRNNESTVATSRRDEQLNQGKWVKAGAQFTGGQVQASSVVAAAEGSDWCLAPLSPIHGSENCGYGPFSPTPSSPFSSLRIKFERIGSSLWIWYRQPNAQFTPNSPNSPFFSEAAGSDLDASGGWTKLREVAGFFAPSVGGLEDKAIWIGVYASRPFGGVTPLGSVAGMSGLMWERRNGRSITQRGLSVEFEDLEIF